MKLPTQFEFQHVEGYLVTISDGESSETLHAKDGKHLDKLLKELHPKLEIKITPSMVITKSEVPPKNRWVPLEPNKEEKLQ